MLATKGKHISPAVGNRGILINNGAQREEVIVLKLSPDAKWPEQMTSLSAGFDLSLPRQVTFHPFKTQTVPFDLFVSLGNNTPIYIRGADRSSIAGKGLHLGSSIVDHNRNISLSFTNASDQAITFGKGCRIAQLIFKEIEPLWDTYTVVQKTGKGFSLAVIKPPGHHMDSSVPNYVPVIFFSLYSPLGITPVQSLDGRYYKLFVSRDIQLPSNKRTCVQTDVCLNVSAPNVYGRLALA